MHRIVLFFACVAAGAAVLVEVINPHSMVNSSGAFLRAAGLGFALPVWMWFAKRWNKPLLVKVSALLAITAGIYLLYGISCWRQEVLYENSVKHNQL